MRIGVRGKLFAVSVFLILAAVLGSGLFLRAQLRSRLEARIEEELTRDAHATRELIAETHTNSIGVYDDLAVHIGAAVASRVTVIGPNGEVLGDSELKRTDVARAENHGNRPEVVAALAHGKGVARRYSTTVQAYQLYVAVPADVLGGLGVVRVAKPLAEVDAAVAALRSNIFAAGLIGLLAAMLMSALASHWMSSALKSLADSARAIADRGASRVDVRSTDELGLLAGSLNKMAGEIEETVDKLASERARFEAVLEGMSDAVIALDKERRVTLMNRAALELLQLREPAKDRSLVELVRVPALQEIVDDADDTPAAAEFDLPGLPKRVLARVRPLPGGTGCVVVMHDVTDMRRLERIRRDFVANVSHELRTPISIVQANAETLIDGAIEDGEHAVPLVEAIHRNAARLSQLISDLLDLSRLEAGRYELDGMPVSVTRAAERAMQSVERAARAKSTSIVLEAPGDIEVFADPKALDQVLVNLMENAVKYTPEGSTVRVAARGNDTSVRMEVIDDGPGIDAAHRARIFERFYRVDPGRSRDMGGTGLGLSIVKHLVDAMHGNVGVEPASPHGSVFWVELPVAR